MFDLFPVSKRQEELNNDILVWWKSTSLFGGGGVVGVGGRVSAQYLQVIPIILDFVLKKKRRLDKACSAINVAGFNFHFGWILLDLYVSHAPENARNVG